MTNANMEILTERCLIRYMNIEDADDLYEILSDEKVMMHIEPVFDREQTKKFIIDAGLQEKPLVYAVVWKRTGKVIGHVIFHLYEEFDYEIGWILHRDYWGLGIADELTKVLLQQAKVLGGRAVL